MNKQAQLQISFGWLFAIIVGAFILFIAIYAAANFISMGEEASTARTGKEIGALLNPLETGFESGRSVPLTMPLETRIHNQCDSGIGNFGQQRIRISQLSLNKWTETQVDSRFVNKYIFSEDIVQGNDFFVFSKPFFFPFKVSDLIYLTSADKTYCFHNPSTEIKTELNFLNQPNLIVNSGTGCPENSVKVCFSSSMDCDIKVNELSKSVEKRGQIVYYETDALMYAAIFSDSRTYECNVNRLMKRTKELTFLYHEKEETLKAIQCDPYVNVITLASVIEGINESQKLNIATYTVRDITNKNAVTPHRLW